jgi:hypothetical protein
MVRRLRKQKAAALRALRAARAKAAKKQAAANGKQKLKPVDLADVRNRLVNRIGLIDKREVLAIIGCTYPVVWEWQRDGRFPLGHTVVGKTMWHALAIADWLDGLPVRPVKAADAPPDQKIEEHEPA